MFSFLTSEFFIHLVYINVFLIVSFILINYHYHNIVDRLESITVTSKSLDLKQRKILKRFFPFYNKLSPLLQRLFEQKLLFFFYMKEYEGVYGLLVHDRMKLFLSAYAAQVSLGFRAFGFSHIFKIKIYPQKFYSASKKIEVCWELDGEGTLHLSWKDFFEQLRKEVILPIGLEIMAHAIKKDENRIKNEIFLSRYLLYYNPYSIRHSGQKLFKNEDFRSKEDFMEACIKNYFGKPLELKNASPDLFKRIDELMYSQIRFTR